MADEEFVTYTVDNEYSISVPSFTKDENHDPDRFSLIRVATDLDCDLDVKNIGFWAVYVESDTREVYEARRKKEGNLDKYPFSLKGLYDVNVKKGEKSLQLIGPVQDSTINGMPALLQIYKTKLDITVSEVSIIGYLIHVQAANGKIYRINIVYPPFETENEEDIPQWVLETCSSFKLL